MSVPGYATHRIAARGVGPRKILHFPSYAKRRWEKKKHFPVRLAKSVEYQPVNFSLATRKKRDSFLETSNVLAPSPCFSSLFYVLIFLYPSPPAANFLVRKCRMYLTRRFQNRNQRVVRYRAVDVRDVVFSSFFVLLCSALQRNMASDIISLFHRFGCYSSSSLTRYVIYIEKKLRKFQNANKNSQLRR